MNGLSITKMLLNQCWEKRSFKTCFAVHINDLVQDGSNSIANARVLLDSWTKPSICLYITKLMLGSYC